MEAETYGETLHDVEAEAAADTLADRLGEVKPKTLWEKCHDTGRDKTLSDMEAKLPTTLTKNTDQDTYRHTGRS